MKFFQKKFRGQTCGRTSDPGKRGGKPPSVNATYLRFGIIGKLRNDLLSNEQMLGARYGWKAYRAMLEEVAAGEAIEREDAANGKGVAA